MCFSARAPTAAADDLAVRDGDEVRAVVDQELIRNGQVDERAGHLFVVVREASDLAQRFPHDAGDAVDVVARRLADLDHFDFSDCTSWATWASPGRMALSFAATARRPPQGRRSAPPGRRRRPTAASRRAPAPRCPAPATAPAPRMPLAGTPPAPSPAARSACSKCRGPCA